MQTQTISQFLANGYQVLVREETLDGIKYLVVPTVMITTGIHNGSNGPINYQAEDLAKSTVAWDSKPVVVYHPQKSDGTPKSAANPETYAKAKIGFLMNTSFDEVSGKLKTESWIDINKANQVDPRIVANIRAGVVTEVSTGLDADIIIMNGVNTAINHRPDHFAILPDGVGACSTRAGAGLLTNESRGIVNLLNLEMESRKTTIFTNGMSYGEIYNGVQKALCNKFGEPGKSWYGDVIDLYDGLAVYADPSGKSFSHSYKMDGNAISLVGEPQQVTRVAKYMDTKGNMIGNQSQETSMNPKDLVNALIANGQFTEADRPDLEKMGVATLTKLQKPATPPPAAQTTQITNSAPTAQVLDVNTFLAMAPLPIRTMLVNGLNAAAEVKKNNIATIMNAQGNIFTEAALQAMPDEALKGIVALIPGAGIQNFGLSPEAAAFFGAGGAPFQMAPLTTNAGAPAPLGMPEMSFERPAHIKGQ